MLNLDMRCPLIINLLKTPAVRHVPNAIKLRNSILLIRLMKPSFILSEFDARETSIWFNSDYRC